LALDIIMRWIDVCVVADDDDGDGDIDEIRVRLLWNNISSNCSWAISGGGGGGKGSFEGFCLGGNCAKDWLLVLFFSIVDIEPLVLIVDRCWLDVSDVPRVNELLADLFPLKWCKSFWKCDTGLTGVGGGRSIAARDKGGEAWTSKWFAIIVDEAGGRDAEEFRGGAGDIDLIVFVLSCEVRFLTKIIILVLHLKDKNVIMYIITFNNCQILMNYLIYFNYYILVMVD
jgi:hypothetical protein